MIRKKPALGFDLGLEVRRALPKNLERQSIQSERSRGGAAGLITPHPDQRRRHQRIKQSDDLVGHEVVAVGAWSSKLPLADGVVSLAECVILI